NAWVVTFDPNGANAGSVWHTSDSGHTWVAQPTAAYTTSSFPDIVYFFNDTVGLTLGDPVGGKFEIFTTTDGGNNWTKNNNAPAASGSSE
ncbi:hypothetical protein NL533_31455, partial [Klebsiella pneumoniae]|nr:hypothetical protein [Klebsiella pneumoniae]